MVLMSKSTVYGYYLHFSIFFKPEIDRIFWDNSSIYCLQDGMKYRQSILFVFCYSYCNMSLAALFSVVDSGMFPVGILKGITSNHSPIVVASPHAIRPLALASFVYDPFEKY